MARKKKQVVEENKILEEEKVEEVPKKKKKKVKEKKEKPKKPKKHKKPNFFLMRTEIVAAQLIDIIDSINDEIDAKVTRFFTGITDLGALVIIKIDQFFEWFEWIIGKGVVIILRYGFNFRMYLHNNKKSILELFAFLIISGVILSTTYSKVIVYKYAYNGQVLGIVEEERYVTEIIELMGGELSDQYGKTVRIDPKLDIEFIPTLSINKSIDSMDTVLSKFCTVSDVKVSAYGIYKNGKFLIALSSEKAASSVLTKIKSQYLNSYTEYSSIEFKENVEVKELIVSLSEIKNEEYAVNFLCTGGDKINNYEIKIGDTIESIAKEFGTNVTSFKELNPDIGDLKVGDVIDVRTENPVLTVVTTGVSTYTEEIPFSTEEIESNKYYETYKFTEVEGENGTKEIVATVSQSNGEIVSINIITETVILEPKTEVVIVGSKEIPPLQGTGKLLAPLTSYGISCEYGYGRSRVLGTTTLHRGIDLTARTGTEIYAADGGTVVFSGDAGTSGLVVIIDHGGLLRTKYGHCSKLLVEVGDVVSQGTVIALVGHSGIATGSHLHFEVQYNGDPVNPREYVDFN